MLSTLNTNQAPAKSTNLYDAHRQWANRPDDERFWSLADMREKFLGDKRGMRTATVQRAQLRVANGGDGEVCLVGPTGRAARLTDFAFGQLCADARAPASYLRQLPSTVAASALGFSIASAGRDDVKRELVLHDDDAGDLVLRGMVSESYRRVWNDDVLALLEGLGERGWRVPPARPARHGQPGARVATEADVIDFAQGGGGLNVKVGDEIAPAGLYGSAHDMFAFMVNPERRVHDGSEGGLSRGFFLRNSEVGASSWSLTDFMLRNVCGNHIVWGAEDVFEVRFAHVGEIGRRWREAVDKVAKFVDAAGERDEQRVRAAQTMRLGATSDDVVDVLYGKKLAGRGDLERAIASSAAFEGLDGDPLSVWGVANGLTRISQEAVHADKRADLDRAAGKVLAMAF